MDDGPDALIVVEDDGAGAEPDVIRAALERGGGRRTARLGRASATSTRDCGRSSATRYGLVVETAPAAGTKVSFRVPKFAPGVHAEGRRGRPSIMNSQTYVPHVCFRHDQ